MKGQHFICNTIPFLRRQNRFRSDGATECRRPQVLAKVEHHILKVSTARLLQMSWREQLREPSGPCLESITLFVGSKSFSTLSFLRLPVFGVPWRCEMSWRRQRVPWYRTLRACWEWRGAAFFTICISSSSEKNQLWPVPCLSYVVPFLNVVISSFKNEVKNCKIPLGRRKCRAVFMHKLDNAILGKSFAAIPVYLTSPFFPCHQIIQDVLHSMTYFFYLP